MCKTSDICTKTVKFVLPLRWMYSFPLNPVEKENPKAGKFGALCYMQSQREVSE